MKNFKVGDKVIFKNKKCKIKEIKYYKDIGYSMILFIEKSENFLYSDLIFLYFLLNDEDVRNLILEV